MARSEACRNCQFWDVYGEGISPGEMGDCRRHPPAISEALLARILPGGLCDPRDELETSLYPASAFPITHRNSWCGEHSSQWVSPC